LVPDQLFFIEHQFRAVIAIILTKELASVVGYSYFMSNTTEPFLSIDMKFDFIRIPEWIYGRLAFALTFVFLLTFSAIAGQNPVEKYYFLGSGTEGAPYNRTAIEIASVLNQVFSYSVISPLPTAGSKDNIERMRDAEAELIIIQRDVLSEVYYDRSTPFKDLEIILPLFPEALQIFVHSDKKLITITEFQQEVLSGRISRIGIGPDASSTNQTTRKIFGFLSFHLNDSVFDRRPHGELIADFASGKLDSYIFFAAVPLRALDNDTIQNIAMVTFEETDFNRILPHQNNLEMVTINSESYSFIPQNQLIKSVGTWAFLAGRRGTVNEIATIEGKSMVQELLKAIVDSAALFYSKEYYGEKKYFDTKLVDGQFEIGADSNRKSDFFRGMPASTELELLFAEDFELDSINLIPIIVVIVVLILLLYNLLQSGSFRESISLSDSAALATISRIRHFLIIFLGLVLSYILFSELIRFSELRYLQNYAMRSPLLDISRIDLYRWLFLFIFADYDGNLFPLSTGGQVLVAVAQYMIFIAIFLAVVVEIIISKRNKKYMDGLAELKFKNHIVVCGWNEGVLPLVQKILSAPDQVVHKKKNKVVLIHERAKELTDDRSIDRAMKARKFGFIPREVREKKAMESSNIDLASTVILLADNSSIEADERTLLRALAISRYCQEKEGTIGDYIYIVAEVNNLSMKATLLEAGVNEVICTSDLGNKLMIQSIFNHGVTDVLEEILSYDDYNEFYLLDVDEHDYLIGKTFDKILIPFRKHFLLPIGIKIGFVDGEGDELIEIPEIKKRLKEMELNRQILVNPIAKNEVEYEIQLHDQIVLLAADPKSIRKGMVNVKANFDSRE
jgi:voltage-gated potassium channel